jgi:anti-anti-sigma factor
MFLLISSFETIKYFNNTMNQLPIEIEKTPNGIIAIPVGELGMPESQYLKLRMEELLSRPIKKLAIDLTKVSLLSSIALSTLIHLNQKAHERNISFCVVCPEGPVHDIFTSTGVDKTISLVSSRSLLAKNKGSAYG